jgi:hypothetical protein
MDKELTVNLANLNQAETIRTRLEKQVDSLDVTNAYSERKINDLQKYLDAQYDIIDETEELLVSAKIRGLEA